MYKIMTLQDAIDVHQLAYEKERLKYSKNPSDDDARVATDAFRYMVGWLTELDGYRKGQLHPDALQQLRYDAARDFMAALLTDGQHLEWTHDCLANLAVKYADALINELKK